MCSLSFPSELIVAHLQGSVIADDCQKKITDGRVAPQVLIAPFLIFRGYFFHEKNINKLLFRHLAELR